mgnify:CR=1
MNSFSNADKTRDNRDESATTCTHPALRLWTQKANVKVNIGAVVLSQRHHWIRNMGICQEFVRPEMLIGKMPWPRFPAQTMLPRIAKLL